MWRLPILAAFISLVVIGCDVLGNREANKMDGNNVDRTVELTDTLKQTGAMVPPIDLVEPPQIETATFALG